MIIVSPGTDIIPEFSFVAAQSWGGELDLGDNNECIGDMASGDTEGQLQIDIIDECCGYQIQAHDGKGWQWLRLRNSLITDASQAVIGRHEQVVSGDMARRFCRKSFGLDGFREGVPFQLLIVIEILPFTDSALVNGQLHLLASGTGKGWPCFCLEETFSVLVKECDVSDRCITVGE